MEPGCCCDKGAMQLVTPIQRTDHVRHGVSQQHATLRAMPTRVMPMARIGLSKSKIISGLQCPKRLYLGVHRPELAEVSDETERMVLNGHLVGEIAR